MMPRLSILLVALLLVVAHNALAAERPPNVVIIYCDDLGYGDIASYGRARRCVDDASMMRADDVAAASLLRR